jgi:hypothetical protein
MTAKQLRQRGLARPNIAFDRNKLVLHCLSRKIL